MRTTLDLDDRLIKEAKARALARDETLTRFIEESLQARLRELDRARAPFRFEPVTKRGERVPGLDFADRDALYERMGERD
jgi:hypothetical protein